MPTDQVCAVADPGSQTRRVVISAAVGGLLSFTLGGFMAIAAGLVALWALPQVPARAHTSALLILALIVSSVHRASGRLQGARRWCSGRCQQAALRVPAGPPHDLHSLATNRS